MNIHQFKYILAVSEFKHFETAAEKCFISQSTLSTMISKFEDEIGVKIFDRKKKPVELTLEGKLIIEQIKIVSSEIEQLTELTKEIKGEIAGNLNLSVIPTVAPFLLPLFLQEFAMQFPKLNIMVKEETTEEIMKKLKSRELDIGIVSIPLHDEELIEIKLYDEPFLFYDTKSFKSKIVSVKEMKNKSLCLMEEGHCMRTQVSELCKHNPYKNKHVLNFEYKAGSIDSLIRFAKSTQNATLLPFLATLGFSNQEKKHLSDFTSPKPFRAIGLVIHRHFVKKKMLTSLQKSIMEKTQSIIPSIENKGNKLSPV